MKNGEEVYLQKVEQIINQWKNEGKAAMDAIDDIYDAYSEYSKWDEERSRKRLREELMKNAQAFTAKVTYGGRYPSSRER